MVKLKWSNHSASSQAVVLMKSKGPVVRYGPGKLIFFNREAIRDIYSKTANVQKSIAYRAFETSPTAHDLQSTVNKTAHARKRRVIGQAFSDSALRVLERHVVQHVDTFVGLLASGQVTDKNPTGGWTEAVNMTNWCNYLSFDYMSELVFGKTFGMLEFADNRYIIDLIQSAAFRVGVCLQMPRLVTWNIDGIIAPKVRALRDKYIETSKAMAIDRMKMDGGRKDLFSHILAAKDPETGKGFSMDEIWGESTLLIIAGSDAISTAMAGCFFYLSRHQGAYLKARREVRDAFSSVDDVRTGQTLNDCAYLRACIDEALRMSPPVGASLWREVCRGGTTVDGHAIPQGFDVGVGIYAIQHNPAYFPDPFTYRPERWIAGESVSAESVVAAKASFSAFSIGPVGCVGKNLAYMELMLTMARVLWSLDFKPVAGVVTAGARPESYLRRYEDHAENEYHLRDRFTSWKDGPMLAFKPRE